MILTVDIGNTNTVLGIYNDNKLKLLMSMQAFY